MKKCIRVLGITVLAVIIGFVMTACGGTGGGGDRIRDLPPAGDGRISFAETFQVYTRDGEFAGSRSFAYIWWEDEDGNDEYFELSVILSEPRTVSIANGTLTLQLGSPTASAPWITLSEIAPSGITVTAGLRIVEIFEFITSRNSGIRYSLFWEGEYGDVSLVYADRAGRVSGSFFDDEEGMWILVNWDLRQGWNTVLNTETAAEGISVTGRPGNDFRWITSQW